jgi:hypothetical protein
MFSPNTDTTTLLNDSYSNAHAENKIVNVAKVNVLNNLKTRARSTLATSAPYLSAPPLVSHYNVPMAQSQRHSHAQKGGCVPHSHVPFQGVFQQYSACCHLQLEPFWGAKHSFDLFNYLHHFQSLSTCEHCLPAMYNSGRTFVPS